MAGCLDPLVRPTPRTLGATVSDEVEAAFARATRLDPRERFRDAGEFWRSLCAAASFSEQKRVPIVLSSELVRSDVAPAPPATTLPTQVDEGASAGGLSETGSRTALASPPRPGRPPASRARVAARRLSLLFAGSALAWFGVTTAQKLRRDESLELGTPLHGASATAVTPPNEPGEAPPGVSAAVAAHPIGVRASSADAPLHATAMARSHLRNVLPAGSQIARLVPSPATAPTASAGLERTSPSPESSAARTDADLRRLMNADAFSLRK
jgi:hypothetical protein